MVMVGYTIAIRENAISAKKYKEGVKDITSCNLTLERYKHALLLVGIVNLMCWVSTVYHYTI